MATVCATGNNFDGRIGVRISSIFIILLGSLLGAWFPLLAARREHGRALSWLSFVAKYFGSGVIVATAFIHLLAPANQALTNPCLSGVITTYDWAEGICLMAIFILFFVELMMMRYGKFGVSHGHGAHAEPPINHHHHESPSPESRRASVEHSKESAIASKAGEQFTELQTRVEAPNKEDSLEKQPGARAESYSTQLAGVFILEFGVIFHSIFIGLALAVAGKDFSTLYAVLTFHQTFEGLALGSRLTSIKWPTAKWQTPYLFGVGYAISTPLAIAIGLDIRSAYDPGSPTGLITNGVFDSISAGILIYTGLIELMAHEFLFSEHMQCASTSKMLSALFTMCGGAFLMALLGKWT